MSVIYFLRSTCKKKIAYILKPSREISQSFGLSPQGSKRVKN